MHILYTEHLIGWLVGESIARLSFVSDVLMFISDALMFIFDTMMLISDVMMFISMKH